MCLGIISSQGGTGSAHASDDIVIDFEDGVPGALVERDWIEGSIGPVEWCRLEGRARFDILDREKALRVSYPVGAFRSKESGAQFVVTLPPKAERYLSYRVYFPDDFRWVKGGKLPGLASGGSRYTGGRKPGPEGGWSARYMWRRDGELGLYFYHPGMTGSHGERHSLDFRCPRGRWIELVQRVVINDGEEGDLIEVWIDRVRALRLTRLELSGTERGQIDTFLFSTFFGGNDPSWAPSESGVAWFDDIRIAESPPRGIRNP